jgi:Flp pilus assembly protein TadD
LAPPPAQPTPDVVVAPQPSSSAIVVAPASAAPALAAAPAAGAAKEREASRFALERGDLGTAVAAGERSVALDPSDGEAWLVLGAAYQARGELAQAKRCYRLCVEQGTRGPKAECRAMAQGE